MKKAVLLLICLVSLAACTRKVYVPVERKTIERIVLHDTIVETRLDVIRDSVAVKDTVSFLQNKYAESSARWSGGELHHTLRTKDVPIPVKVQYVEKLRVDSIPVAYPEPYPVEKPLTRWQTIRINIGNIALAVLALLLVYGIVKRKIIP